MTPKPLVLTASALTAFLFMLGAPLAATAQETPPPSGEQTAPTPPPPDGGTAQPPPPAQGQGQQDGARGQGRGNRGGRGQQGMGGMMRGMMGGRMLRGAMDQLGLTDDQKKKVEEITNRFSDETSKLLEERMDRLFDEVAKVCTDEQRAKLYDLKARFTEMRRGRTQGGTGGDTTGRPQDGGRRGGMRGGDRMVEEATKALGLSAEDEQIIGPMIKKVVDARNTQMQTMREKRRSLDEFARTGGANEKELGTRLAEYRKARDEAEAAMKAAQQELKSLLTIDQEAKLVGLGVLE